MDNEWLQLFLFWFVLSFICCGYQVNGKEYGFHACGGCKPVPLHWGDEPTKGKP